ncbi:hypothetical protein TNIN_329371 [Trichonephila inaurata madagascariensis]|uniref:Uncharacterized protein n=1 Tax=Trichonephila inaurata madagascariensis TaxID=2747483 RepID=A0A8X6WLI6_9ARAC|nr:hypothetical protein TNIN_329371 [Trichonephila inaurata madagascariensis]
MLLTWWYPMGLSSMLCHYLSAWIIERECSKVKTMFKCSAAVSGIRTIQAQMNNWLMVKSEFAFCASKTYLYYSVLKTIIQAITGSQRAFDSL